MWRGRTSSAEIAGYVLTKLHNYGRAFGHNPARGQRTAWVC